MYTGTAVFIYKSFGHVVTEKEQKNHLNEEENL